MKNDKTIIWESFKYISPEELSDKTGAAYSSLNKWKKTRAARVRLLELSVIAPYLSDDERTSLLEDKALTIPQLLTKIGAKNNFSVTLLPKLIGESRRTIYSWWLEQGSNKRKLLLAILEGLLVVLAVEQSKQINAAIANDDEKEAIQYFNCDKQKIEVITSTIIKLEIK